MTITASPQIGLGTTFSIGTLGGSPTYTAIGGNTKLQPAQAQMGHGGTSPSLASPPPGASSSRRFIDQGEASGSGFWESGDAGQNRLAGRLPGTIESGQRGQLSLQACAAHQPSRRANHPRRTRLSSMA